MKEPKIHAKILQAMKLTPEELAVFDLLVKNKNIFGIYSSQISDKLGISNKITRRILSDFEKRGLTAQVFEVGNIRSRWKFKRGLEKLESRRERRLRFREQAEICAQEELEAEEAAADAGARGSEGGFL